MLTHTEQAVAQAAVRYDRAGDQHYDVASALIKSMRGSDVDAALHYLARMLEAGEDPRFIARRIVIAASEDVGMADPTALQTAVAAMHAVAQIGMPEARIILAQAVVHNAMAPEVERLLPRHRRRDRRRAGRQGRPGARLTCAGAATPGAARLGHGEGYPTPTTTPDGVAAQQYLPDDLARAPPTTTGRPTGGSRNASGAAGSGLRRDHPASGTIRQTWAGEWAWSIGGRCAAHERSATISLMPSRVERESVRHLRVRGRLPDRLLAFAVSCATQHIGTESASPQGCESNAERYVGGSAEVLTEESSGKPPTPAVGHQDVHGRSPAQIASTVCGTTRSPWCCLGIVLLLRARRDLRAVLCAEAEDPITPRR